MKRGHHFSDQHHDLRSMRSTMVCRRQGDLPPDIFHGMPHPITLAEGPNADRNTISRGCGPIGKKMAKCRFETQESSRALFYPGHLCQSFARFESTNARPGHAHKLFERCRLFGTAKNFADGVDSVHLGRHRTRLRHNANKSLARWRFVSNGCRTSRRRAK